MTEVEKEINTELCRKARQLANKLEAFWDLDNKFLDNDLNKSLYSNTIHELRSFARSLQYSVEKDHEGSIWWNKKYAVSYTIKVGTYILKMLGGI